MKSKIKSILLGLVFVLALPLRLIPAGIRQKFLFGMLLIDSRAASPRAAMKQLFLMEDIVRLLINERAMVVGEGVHPKHRLMNYHKFFIDNAGDTDTILDVGCGYGAVARSLAKAKPQARVTGIDFDQRRINEALAMDNPENLSFVCGDALKSLPDGRWDIVMMSNVLEHIDGRVDFLRHLGQALNPGRLLIRVPQFERDWTLPMRHELGVNYFSDPTHFIEHTLDEFYSEMETAGVEVLDMQTVWGEIWAVCAYKSQEAEVVVNA